MQNSFNHLAFQRSDKEEKTSSKSGIESSNIPNNICSKFCPSSFCKQGHCICQSKKKFGRGCQHDVVQLIDKDSMFSNIKLEPFGIVLLHFEEMQSIQLVQSQLTFKIHKNGENNFNSLEVRQSDSFEYSKFFGGSEVTIFKKLIDDLKHLSHYQHTFNVEKKNLYLIFGNHTPKTKIFTVFLTSKLNYYPQELNQKSNHLSQNLEVIS